MSSTRILVGTVDGLHELDTDGRLEAIHHPARSVVALAGTNSELWALLDGAEVWRTAGVHGWASVAPLGDLRGHCLAVTRAGTLIGTSQARLLRVTATGLEELTAFDEVRGRSTWYTPWGDPADTRSIADDAEAVYVNVHVGGIPRSRDLGDTWVPTIDVDADVHQVWTAPGRVLAACARVAAIGFAFRGPLARIPRSFLQLVVGGLLTSFGTFWALEGLGVDWPQSDFDIVLLAIFYGLVAAAYIAPLRRLTRPTMHVVYQ